MSENTTAGARSGDEERDDAARQVEPSPHELAELSESSIQDGGGPDLDVVLDIPVRVAMEVGHAEIRIRDLLKLTRGSVVELDRLAGDPLDVFVNGTLIAYGEVVVVNDRFGIRLTDVISPAERIRQLK